MIVTADVASPPGLGQLMKTAKLTAPPEPMLPVLLVLENEVPAEEAVTCKVAGDPVLEEKLLPLIVGVIVATVPFAVVRPGGSP